MLLILVSSLITEVNGCHSIDVHGQNVGAWSITELPTLWLLIELGKGALAITTVGLSITIFCAKSRNKERPGRSTQTEVKETEVKLQLSIPNHRPSVVSSPQGSNEQRNKPSERSATKTADRSPDWKGMATSNAFA